MNTSVRSTVSGAMTLLLIVVLIIITAIIAVYAVSDKNELRRQIAVLETQVAANDILSTREAILPTPAGD